MAEKKNIYETINAVMADVGAIGKEKRNQQQGFMYRGIDDVMNALNPAFAKHRLFIVPEIMEQRRVERQTAKGGNLIYSVCRIKFTFYAGVGSHIEAVVIGEGMDSGDKATNKAMSIAFKYACFQVFCIPTEEMTDPDQESHETRPQNAPNAQQQHQRAGARQGQKQQENKPPQLINEQQLNELMKECDRTGKHWRDICALYKVEKFSAMTVDQYANCMKRFKSTPDKPVPEPEVEGELPWNNPS